MNEYRILSYFLMSTLIVFGLISSCIQDNLECNLSIRNFLNENTGIISIPTQIDGKLVKSAHAIVYFRESHGGFQSSFGFKNLDSKDSNEKIVLFTETKFSNKNQRGEDDWLGNEEGGILGTAPYMKKVELLPNTRYVMNIENIKAPPFGIKKRENARYAKTNFIDPVPDYDIKKFTFYERQDIEPPRKKSLFLLNPQGPSISTIVGFEDNYKHEQTGDYNDIIVEVCLKVNY